MNPGAASSDRLIVLASQKTRHALWLSPRMLIIALAAVLVILAPSIFLRSFTQLHLYTDARFLSAADAALIPGASVVHGEPSPVLAERALAAIRLYQEGRVRKILVTGDNGDRTYDEVTPVRTYLMNAGVPENDIFLDRAGFDTYSSMYRARTVFGVNTLIIVTQDFHLPRAVFLARFFGIDAEGLTAKGGTLSGYMREVPASWKALWDALIGRQPKYLGAPISISGRGNK